MGPHIGRRLGTSVITLLGVALSIFAIMRLMPGDPGRVVAGFDATPEQVEQVRQEMGLDKPVTTQFARYVGDLATGDLGTSAMTGQPVRDLIADRLPYTIQLAVAGAIIGTLLGVGAGILAATRHGRPVDYLVSTISVLGVSMPVYWLGLLLIIAFSINLRWFPAAGASEVSSIVLPGLSVGVFFMALVARMTRSAMLDELGQDYVRTARAKGLKTQTVLLRHALHNAALPIVTIIGLQFAALLGGSILTETVFGWPGIGRALVDAIFNKDLPVVQGIVFVYAVLVILVNLFVDVLYAVIDPRIRY